MRRLILRSFQSPGDVLMLTAAVRDLHRAAPKQFEIDVRTSAPALWENNPHLTRMSDGTKKVETIEMQYPLIHQSNKRPYHFIHGYVQFLEQKLNLRIPVTDFGGDIHLTDEERRASPPGSDLGVQRPYWIVMAGGKFDFTAKWWNPISYQAVVDAFQGRLQFVQCGEENHWHPRLNNVVNLVGKTGIREFIRLMFHADGVLCPVTFAMHLAAAVETPSGAARQRACVVVAGGREPPQWEAYPYHQFISTNGMLSCCSEGGCWKSRCQLVGDGDSKDHSNLCEQPVQLTSELRIPRCMDMISPQDVIRRIEMYYTAGERHARNGALRKPPSPAKEPVPVSATTQPVRRKVEFGSKKTIKVLVKFRHGLGDAIQFTAVLEHIRQQRPDWIVDVAARTGKQSSYRELCRRTIDLDREPMRDREYERVINVEWHECHSSHAGWPSTKVARSLIEEFGLTPDAELFRYRLPRTPQKLERAQAYLDSLCQGRRRPDGRYPALLLHYEGNTSGDRKNLPHELAREICSTAEAAGYVPIILDWDNRSPLIDGRTIHNPDQHHPLWGGTGTGDAEQLAALIDCASLLVGVDSGPLHVAGATQTPTIGVWTQHHPVHFFDLADNVVHLVPTTHTEQAAGPEARDFFRQRYEHQEYRNLQVELPGLVEHMLTDTPLDRAVNQRFLRMLSARSYNQQYYDQHKLYGLDYLAYGDWQRRYGEWIVEALGMKGKRLLDVGCACGAILRGFGDAGAVSQGVDLSEYMVQLGRQKWPDMARLLHVCDAVNLHLFGDASWDGIHSAQVAEHWKPELVPFILRELARIVRPGGLFFCALDTEELFARQNRHMEEEDPTHVCIRPRAWWIEQLHSTGWQDCTSELDVALRQHPKSYLQQYDWDWFVARRAST